MMKMKLLTIVGLFGIALAGCSQNPSYTPVGGYATTGVVPNTGVYPGVAGYPYTNGIVNTVSPMYQGGMYTTGFYSNPYVMNPYLYYNYSSAYNPQAALQAQLMFSLSFRANPNFYYPTSSSDNCALRRQPTFTQNSCACYSAPCNCDRVLEDYRASRCGGENSCGGSVRQTAPAPQQVVQNSCNTAASARNTCHETRRQHKRRLRRGGSCSPCNSTTTVYGERSAPASSSSNSSGSFNSSVTGSSPSSTRLTVPTQTKIYYGSDDLDKTPTVTASTKEGPKLVTLQPDYHPTLKNKDARALYELLATQEVGSDADKDLPAGSFKKMGQSYFCVVAGDRTKDESYMCDFEIFSKDGKVADADSKVQSYKSSAKAIKAIADYKSFKGPSLIIGSGDHPEIGFYSLFDADKADEIFKKMTGASGEPAAIKLNATTGNVDPSGTINAMIKTGKQITCIQTIPAKAGDKAVTNCVIRLQSDKGIAISN